MNMMIEIVRRFVGSWTGSRFAKGNDTKDNGTTTYTFSGRGSDNKNNGKKMKLQPVTVRSK
ncbi:MAG: hypothetical protein QM762_05635 [Chryseolinea sp.]